MKILTAATGLACVALSLSGCGSDSGSASGATSGGSGKNNVKITSPSDGADVTLPVTLKFTANKAIGPLSSGKDHVHVIIDGKTNEYTVVTSSPYQIKNMPMGKHTIGVTLQHADHSPDGASTSVTVNVTGGSSGGSGGGNSGGSGGGGGGGYGY